MPKFLVKMNVVEARQTSFVIEANCRSDVRDGLAELDYNFFEKKCDWVCADYEPPIIEDIEEIKADPSKKGFTSIAKNRTIQNRFNKIIETFNKAEANDE